MAGFRPLSRTWGLVATFPLVLGGFAVSTAAGLPAWLGGGLGGATGAGLAMVLDQRQARIEHGKGMSVGLVVTDERLFVLELATGLVAASVVGVDVVADRGEILSVETERMQGSGLKRPGVVLALRDGTEVAVIPAKTDQFLRALGSA